MTPAEQITSSLNEALSKRRAHVALDQLPTTYWESIGSDSAFRLKDFRTLDVHGSITRTTGFSGDRWIARINSTGATKEFDSAYNAAEFVEVSA